MSDLWFYRLFGEEFGPVPTETLRSLIDSGNVDSSDEVRRDGSTHWQAASQALAAEDASGSVATATESAGEEEEPEWYCQVFGQELGPLSFDELLQFARNGELSAEDDIKLGESGKWRKVGSMGRLVAVLPFREGTDLRPSQLVVKTITESSVAPSIAQPVLATPTSPVAEAVPPAASTPQYHPAAEEMTWYAWIRGAEYGPTNLLQLAKWWETGHIGPADTVRQGMLGQWMPPAAITQALSRLLLTPAVPQVPPPPPLMVSPPQPVMAPPPPMAPAVSAASAKLPAVRLPPPPSADPAPIAPTTSNKPAMTRTASALDTVPERDVTTRSAPEPRPIEPRPIEVPRETSPVRAPVSAASSPAWSPPAKPAYRPPPAKKKSSSGGSSIDFGALKDPKVLGGVGAVVAVVVLFFGWKYLPAATGADRAKLEALQAILQDFRALREKKASDAEFAAFAQKAEAIAKPMAVELEKTANRRAPQKQHLLWASRNRLPEMLQNAKKKKSPSENDFERNLYDAAKILGVAKGDPPAGVGGGGAAAGSSGNSEADAAAVAKGKKGNVAND